MALLTAATLSTTFDLSASPDNFIFTDTSDFAGPSVPEAGALGILKITNPSGSVIYENVGFAASTFGTPDITIATSRVATVNPLIPLNTDGTPVNGTYKVEYKLFVPANGGDPDTTYTATFNPSFTYKSPAQTINLTVDLAQPQLTSTDATSYTVDNVNPTSITRAHTISYPPSVGVGDVTGTGVTLTTSEFYSRASGPLQHSSKVVATLNYTYSTYLVIDQVTGNGFIDIVSGADLCAIYCCLRSQWKRVQNARQGTNEFRIEEQKLSMMTDLAELISSAISCGRDEDVNAYTQQLQDIGNCTDDCNCDDSSDEPKLVTGANPIEVALPSVKTFTPINISGFNLDTNTTSKYWETPRAGNDTAYFQIQWTVTPSGSPATLEFDVQNVTFGAEGFINGAALVSGTAIPLKAMSTTGDDLIEISKVDGSSFANSSTTLYLAGEYEIQD